jgi:NTE family protein
MHKPKVHLVLGSGGARGMAHIGVIEILEEQQYEIISITGCSMGAVVGGMYCAGFLPQYKEWLLSLTKTKVFSLFDFTFTKTGFVKGEKILNKLQEFTGDQHIEHFRIPFTVVATDILHHKEVHYTSGNLFKALRASIGIPGVFTPIIDHHTCLVDGGVLNPLPVNLIQKKHPEEWVVAVNVNGHYERKVPSNDKSKRQKLPAYNVLDLLNTSYDFTQDRLAELMIDKYRPDVLVEIPRNSCTIFDFHRAADLIHAGRTACKKALHQKTSLHK